MRVHARAAGVLRLITVPLSVAVSIAGNGPATGDPIFLAIAAGGFAYALVLWVLVHGGRTLWRGIPLVDLTLLLAFVVAANPRVDPAGRFAALLLVGAWALTSGPRTVFVRGVGFGAAVVLLQLLFRGGSPNARMLLASVVVSVIGALVASEMRRRDERDAALSLRADELLVEVAELERRERARIAQLLHDDALQRLLAARQDLDAGAGGDAAAMVRAKLGFAEATASLRDLTRVVHDDALEAAGLQAAVRRIVDAAADRGSLRASVEVDDRACGEANALVLAVVRELVTNVERHAGATELSVRVARRGDGIVVLVQDDGCGLTAQRLARAEADGHLGHAALRRKVEQLHGTLSIDATPGDGTRVEVRLADADVRARLALERALTHEREWNAALVAGFPDPFIVSTPELQLVEVSDRFVALTGFSRAELLAAPAGDLPYWPLEHRPAIREFAAALNVEEEHEVRFEIVRKDGRRLPVLATASMVVDPRSGRRLQLVTFKDLTVREPTRQALDEATFALVEHTRRRVGARPLGSVGLK